MKLIKIFALTLVLICGTTENNTFAQALSGETLKIGRTLNLIDNWYVDTADIEEITEKVIIDMLRELDPHSTYISAEDVRDANEPLLGNFEYSPRYNNSYRTYSRRPFRKSGITARGQNSKNQW
jgi:carboxyl-terminal processing protease